MSFHAQLVPPRHPGDSWHIHLRRQVAAGHAWSDVATFPFHLGHVAQREYARLRNDNDVAMLLQYWGHEGAADNWASVAAGLPPEGETFGAWGLGDTREEIHARAEAKRRAKEEEKQRREEERIAKAQARAIQLLPLQEYERIIVSFSGGKDSLAAALHVLDEMSRQHIPKSRLELWHQCVDGNPGDRPVKGFFADWPVTEAYVAAAGAALGLPVFWQWREGGYEAEITRWGFPKRVACSTVPGGCIECSGGERGSSVGRMLFPSQADMSVRWCTGTLKIEPCKAGLARDPRLSTRSIGHRPNILLVTGERTEESKNRSYYADAVEYDVSGQRAVHQWRAVLHWSEKQVWDRIRAAGLQPHPCYLLGWSRASCAICIYGGPAQWLALSKVAPALFQKVRMYEHMFERWLHEHPRGPELKHAWIKTGGDVAYQASLAEPSEFAHYRLEPRLVQLAMTPQYDPRWLVVDPDRWKQPAGAYKGSDGGAS